MRRLPRLPTPHCAATSLISRPNGHQLCAVSPGTSLTSHFPAAARTQRLHHPPQAASVVLMAEEDPRHRTEPFEVGRLGGL